jgi:hypothetical protein
MSRALAFFACLVALLSSTTRAEDANYVVFRALHRGVATSVQCNYFGRFESSAFSFQQHGRRLTIRGLNGQLECTAEDGTVIASAKELRVREPWAVHIFKDAITGELVIRAYGVDRDPHIVPVPAAQSTHSGFSN